MYACCVTDEIHHPDIALRRDTGPVDAGHELFLQLFHALWWLFQALVFREGQSCAYGFFTSGFR
jgi:hypothetical protein